MIDLLPIASDVHGSGQPSRDQLAALARDGIRSVINLRHPDEPDQYDERSEAGRHGLHYVSIPVTGAQDLTAATVARFSSELARARAQGPVLVHCASANRVGALVALELGWHQGRDATGALEAGRAAGLAGLEPEVAGLLAHGPA